MTPPEPFQMNSKFAYLLCCLLAVAAKPAGADDIQLGSLFCDGAVLQQGVPLPIWGTAEPGEPITVKFKGQARSTVADPHGRWQAQLGKLAASSEPAQLVVAGCNTTVAVKDVLVGEVWLCSGQSNMLFRVNEGRDAGREIAAGDHPLIREFQVQSMIADDPLAQADGRWKKCSPETVGEFTAVGYYFARELQARLGVPIGIIKATLGGSPIEGWISATALARTSHAAEIARRWDGMAADYNARTSRYENELAEWGRRKEAAKMNHRRFVEPPPAKEYADNDRNRPAGLYNGFIHPLEPCALAGFLWYQGEGNVARAGEYAELFQTLIGQWRADFAQGDRPFLFVQLAGYADPKDRTGEAWAWLRSAQDAALTLKNTYRAVTIDVGDRATIHPLNKQAVGDRLARLALRQAYGIKIGDHGPVLVSMKAEGSGLRLRFTNAAQLTLSGDPGGAFVVAGQDRRFFPACAEVIGDEVMVSSAEVQVPVAVRYNWTDFPNGVLRNADGLPVAPFRSDSW